MRHARLVGAVLILAVLAVIVGRHLLANPADDESRLAEDAVPLSTAGPLSTAPAFAEPVIDGKNLPTPLFVADTAEASVETRPSDPLGGVGTAVHVTARVLDGDGAPLAGARAIWLPNTATLIAAGRSPDTWGMWRPAMQPPTPLDQLPQTMSDAEGRVAFDAQLTPVESEDEWWDEDPTMSVPALLVMRTGWTTRVVSVGKPQQDACAYGDLVLLPEAVVAGRIVDDGGRPLAGVRVRLLHQDIERDVAGSTPIYQAGVVPELMEHTSPPDGRFTFAGLWPGKATIELWAANRVRHEINCEPRSEQTIDLGDLVVERGSSIAGVVVDAAGAPIAGAKLSVVDGEIRGGFMGDVGYGYQPDDDSLHDELQIAEANFRHASVVSEATGAFRFEGLDSPTYSVYARAAGFEPARLRPIAAGTADARLVLQRAAELRITVVDRATRATLPDAQVTVTRDSGVQSGRGDESLAVEALAPGRFVARGAGPRAQQVVASATGHANAVVQAPGVVAPASAEFTVELGPEAVVSGRVVDGQGRPLAGATIELRTPGQPRIPVLQVAADPTGSFRIERLGTASLELVAFAPGAAESAPLPLEVQEGQRVEGLEVRLPPPARIHGTVLQADGTPKPKARVMLDVPPFGDFKFMELSPRFKSWTETDEQGFFAFESLGSGDYQVSAHGLPTVACTLAEGEDRQVDFAANPPSRVHGHVTSAGAPVAGVPVTASNDPADRSQKLGWIKPAITDDSGSYDLEVRAAGDVEVYVDPRGSPESDHRTVHLDPGQALVVDLELPAGQIAGRVVDDVEGAPIAGLDVSLIEGKDLQAGYGETDTDGRFALRWLAPAAYRLHLLGYASVGGRRDISIVSPEPRDIVLAAGESADVELRVCRGATLTGDVRLADGGPVRDGQMVLLVRTSEGRIVPGIRYLWCSGGTRSPGSHLDSAPEPVFRRKGTEQGRYSFIALPPGEYRVLAGQAKPEEVLTLGEPVTLDEHQTLELDLVAK
jgi:protocatechuate 3,4-dioxygenase beta subunit